jgi:hypothetical protein
MPISQANTAATNPPSVAAVQLSRAFQPVIYCLFEFFPGCPIDHEHRKPAYLADDAGCTLPVAPTGCRQTPLYDSYAQMSDAEDWPQSSIFEPDRLLRSVRRKRSLRGFNPVVRRGIGNDNA